MPDYTVSTWYGLWAPKGTPADVQSPHRGKTSSVPAQKIPRKPLGPTMGAEFGTLTPTQYGAFVSNEVKRWAAVVKASGAKLD
jgi:tripartite-type tricarboxylate transporter receptor subunit TctC